jgi:hypothetical protein
MIIYREQLVQMGNKMYASRMRQYLNAQFPETEEIENKELERIILELTDRAAGYKLILETQVAPFIVAAWIMGIDFDQDFIAVKEVLENLDMDSNEKANWLWQFLEDSIEILEYDDTPTEKRSIDRFLK